MEMEGNMKSKSFSYADNYLCVLVIYICGADYLMQNYYPKFVL